VGIKDQQAQAAFFVLFSQAMPRPRTHPSRMGEHLTRRYALPELCVSTDRPHSDAIFGRAGPALPGRLARLHLSSTAK
jgi:hypothetical protein